MAWINVHLSTGSQFCGATVLENYFLLHFTPGAREEKVAGDLGLVDLLAILKNDPIRAMSWYILFASGLWMWKLIPVKISSALPYICLFVISCVLVNFGSKSGRPRWILIDYKVQFNEEALLRNSTRSFYCKNCAQNYETPPKSSQPSLLQQSQ